MNYTWWYTENSICLEDSIGIDEVGRGPLAGPVVSAAVWISKNLAEELEKNAAALPVRDSKKMTSRQRSNVIQWLDGQPLNLIRYSIGSSSVEEIDDINILNAALLSMKRAYEGLQLKKSLLLVDGNMPPPVEGVRIKTIPKGDEKVLAISLASIIAKEYRDDHMRNLSKEFPQYSWDTNVGYGSSAHMQALQKYGITRHHRKTFSPVRESAF
ncbi:MAG: ribonuclease HII [Holosporaceae bacterium]|jgi:ribonuclease HII|nr:ribonuclease HII [Holosporaceae bacterium]